MRILCVLIVILMLMCFVFACSKRKNSISTPVPNKGEVVTDEALSEGKHVIPDNTWPGQVWPNEAYVDWYVSEHEQWFIDHPDVDELDDAHLAMTACDHYYDSSIGDHRVATALLWEDGQFGPSVEDSRLYPDTPKILFQEWDPDVGAWSLSVDVVNELFVPWHVKDDGSLEQLSEEKEFRPHGPIAVQYLAPTETARTIGGTGYTNDRPDVVIAFYGRTLGRMFNPDVNEDDVLCIALGHYDANVDHYEFTVYAILGAHGDSWDSDTVLLQIEPEISLTAKDSQDSRVFGVAVGTDDYYNDGSIIADRRVFCGLYQADWEQTTPDDGKLVPAGAPGYDLSDAGDSGDFWVDNLPDGRVTSVDYIGDGVDVVVWMAGPVGDCAVIYHYIPPAGGSALDDLRVSFNNGSGAWSNPEILDSNPDGNMWTGLQCELEYSEGVTVKVGEQEFYTNMAACWVENRRDEGEPGIEDDLEISTLKFAFRWVEPVTMDFICWSWEPVNNPMFAEPLEVDSVATDYYEYFPLSLQLRNHILHPTLTGRTNCFCSNNGDLQLYDLNYWVFNSIYNTLELRSKVVNHRGIAFEPLQDNWLEMEDSGLPLYLTEGRQTTALSVIRFGDGEFNGNGRATRRLKGYKSAVSWDALDTSYIYYKSNPSASTYSSVGSEYLFDSLGFNYLVRDMRALNGDTRWYSWLVDSQLRQF